MFLTQRNCHRDIYNQFSRGLSLHCPWQQDWYHGCGKSETAGQDNAGTRWLNDYWKATIFHFSMLCWFQIPCRLSVSWNLSLWSVCCHSEIWYLVSELMGGSDPLQCLWLQQRTHWMVHCRFTWKNSHFDPIFLLSPPDSVWKNTVHLNGRDYADAGL